MTDLSIWLEERMRALLGEEYPTSATSYDKERVQELRFNSLKFPGGRGDAVGNRKDEGTREDTGVAEAAERVRQETEFTLE